MKKSHFTIIEVALVLAIGALIFLVVFLAVPALQRNQRNDARKRDISSVVEAVAVYTSNNPKQILKGGYAYQGGTANKTGDNTGLAKYLDTLSTNTEEVIVGRVDQYINSIENDRFFGSDNNRPSRIYVVTGAKCDGSTKLATGSSRSVAVIGGVETSKGHQAYCQDAE